MHWIFENFLGSTRLKQMPQMENSDTVGNIFYHGKVMSDKQIRRTRFLLDILHQVDNLRLNRHIKSGNTLVCNDQRTGNTNTLSLSTGKLMRIILHTLLRLFDSNFFQKLNSTIPCLLLRSFEMPAHTLHNLFSNSHCRSKAGHRILENHGDSFSINMSADPFFIFFQDINSLWSSVCMMVTELNGSLFHLCIGSQNSHCSFHGNRFTGTGLTYDCNCLAFVKVNIDASDSVYRSCCC
ncbi:Uncharacterised protein [uncultured Blautia sp.]|nr:Uncharacterised protein [uncultured Blautia sp.]